MPHFHGNETLILIAGRVEGFGPRVYFAPWELCQKINQLETSIVETSRELNQWRLNVLLHNQSDVSNPLFFTLFACTAECFREKNLSSLASSLAANLFQIFHFADSPTLITDGRSKKFASFCLATRQLSREGGGGSAKTFEASLGTKAMQITTKINYE